MNKEIKSALSENRIIYLSGDFTEQKAYTVVDQLLSFECSDPTRDILLMIDSYGGIVDSFVTIHDTIKNLIRCDVATCCIGKAMSCGQLLLISGTKGKRFMTPNSRVMIHEFTAGSYGKLTDNEITLKENKRLQRVIYEGLNLKYTKLTKPELDKIKNLDIFMDAKKCKEKGFVDHIITTPSDLYKNIEL